MIEIFLLKWNSLTGNYQKWFNYLNLQQIHVYSGDDKPTMSIVETRFNRKHYEYYYGILDLVKFEE